MPSRRDATSTRAYREAARAVLANHYDLGIPALSLTDGPAHASLIKIWYSVLDDRSIFYEDFRFPAVGKTLLGMVIAEELVTGMDQPDHPDLIEVEHWLLRMFREEYRAEARESLHRDIAEVRYLLSAYWPILERLARALLDAQQLDGRTVWMLLDDQPLQARVSIAYHEAGHAVAACLLDIPVTFVSVVLGVCRYNLSDDTELPPKISAICSFAGPIAEMRATGVFDDLHATRDLRSVRWELEELELGDGDDRLFVARALQAADWLIDQHWDVLETVAQALLDQFWLSGDEVLALVRQGIQVNDLTT